MRFPCVSFVPSSVFFQFICFFVSQFRVASNYSCKILVDCFDESLSFAVAFAIGDAVAAADAASVRFVSIELLCCRNFQS